MPKNTEANGIVGNRSVEVSRCFPFTIYWFPTSLAFTKEFKLFRKFVTLTFGIFQEERSISVETSSIQVTHL